MGKEYASFFDVYGTYFNHKVDIKNCLLIPMDLTEGTDALDDIKPDVVIHCAAESDVDVSEADPERAKLSILTMTKNVVAFAKRNSAFLIYISTDALFDGKDEYHKEEDRLNPINVYSAFKAETESFINDRYNQSCIIRSRFYGWNVQDKQCFAEQVISRLRVGKEMICYEDNYSTQILVNNLADIIKEIFQKKITGVFNIVETMKLSRYVFAQMIAEIFELPVELIKPASFVDNTYKTLRAQDTSLSNAKALSFFSTSILSSREGLQEMKRLEENGYREELKYGK